MTTPRTLLAEQFTTDHPAHKVYAYPYAPKEIRANVIAVWRTDVGPHPTAAGLLRHSLVINAYAGATIEERAEAELDDLLDDVLLSLQRVDGVTFDTAERSVFAESFQGWTVKCHCDSPNVYKSQVLTEGQ
jgi:hypothetical protein